MSITRFLSMRREKNAGSRKATVKRVVHWSCGALAVGALLLVHVGGETRSSSNADNSQIPQSAGVVPARSASRVYIDPQTGKLQPAPTNAQKRSAAQALPPEMLNALSTSTAGLQIETGAGGGKMVRLQGRFRHLNMLNVENDSIAGVRCIDPQHIDPQSAGTAQSVGGQK